MALPFSSGATPKKKVAELCEVQVAQQRAHAGLASQIGQVDGRGGLAHPAFVAEDCQNCHRLPAFRV
ncbi:MAG: hypothetical protein V9H69_06220 [Anaerolineae bacterium]